MITRDMLTLLLSYYQVMPAFLDFVFSYGIRERAQGLYYGGFRANCHLGSAPCDQQIPQLGRSNKHIEVCYGLKSAEMSRSRKNWPWSIRPASIYVSFDVENGRTTWIVIEASSKLKEMLHLATGSQNFPDIKTFDSKESSFAAQLAVHFLICEWAAQSWQAIYDFIDDRCQAVTRDILLRKVENPSHAPLDEELPALTSRTSIRTGTKSSVRSFPLSIASKTIFSMRSQTGRHYPTNAEPESSNTVELPRMTGQAFPRNQEHSQIQTTAHAPPENAEDQAEAQVTFQTLQEIQHLEEAMHETASMLKQNVNVLAQLLEFFDSLDSEPGWPSSITESCQFEKAKFRRRLQVINNDYDLHTKRSDMLLKVLGDRKNLVGFLCRTSCWQC